MEGASPRGKAMATSQPESAFASQLSAPGSRPCSRVPTPSSRPRPTIPVSSLTGSASVPAEAPHRAAGEDRGQLPRSPRPRPAGSRAPRRAPRRPRSTWISAGARDQPDAHQPRGDRDAVARGDAVRVSGCADHDREHLLLPEPDQREAQTRPARTRPAARRSSRGPRQQDQTERSRRTKPPPIAENIFD